jgi:hypothetical protein
MLTTLLFLGCEGRQGEITSTTIVDEIVSETVVNSHGYFIVTFVHPILNYPSRSPNVAFNGSSYNLLRDLVGKTVKIEATYYMTFKDASQYLLYDVQSVSVVPDEQTCSAPVNKSGIITTGQQSQLDFVTWMNMKHPILYNLLWNRFQKMKVQ